RDELTRVSLTPESLAEKEKLNPIYLGHLWKMMTQEPPPSFLLESVRNRWREAGPTDVAALTGEIATLQSHLWKKGKRVAHYSRYYEPEQPKTSQPLT